jgi:transposase
MEIRTKSGWSEPFKKRVVDKVESGKLNKAEASRKYNIPGHSTILRWCRMYGKRQYHTPGGFYMTSENQEIVRLNNEIKALKQELEDSRMKNVVMETFVDIAEKELGIPIRKKYGAKQSGQ